LKYDGYKGRKEMSIKLIFASLWHNISVVWGLLTVAVNSYAVGTELSLPVQSNQLAAYYTDHSPQGASGVSTLLPAYQKPMIHFNTQETTVPIKGESFGANTINTQLAYYEAGYFKTDSFLYKLIIYERFAEAGTPVLNIQLNSYDASGVLIDAVLLDSRFRFEEFERFSEFAINPGDIHINHHVTYLYETVNGGEIGQPIVRPTAQVYCREHYKFEQGHFRLVSRVEEKAE
jgi:hypothetical protein